jgi:hypothetical protein
MTDESNPIKYGATSDKGVSDLRGFHAGNMALFIATGPDLTAAFPGWRVPLREAIRRPVRNRFTGELFECRTYDPGPDVSAPVPEILPFDHVLIPSEEVWEERYLALDIALSGDTESMEVLDAEQLLLTLKARGLSDQALCNHAVECDVTVVPQRLTKALVALEKSSLPDLLATWNRHSPKDNSMSELRALWELVGRASVQGKEMFVWSWMSREQ